MEAEIQALIEYAVRSELITEDDRIYAYNRLLEVLRLDEAEPSEASCEGLSLEGILDRLTADAVRRGIIEDGTTAHDLFDTALMGALTPFPHEVRAKFRSLYAQSPEKATDWYYDLSRKTNYIRTERVARDLKWTYDGKYGALDITINLSKPEKDPRAIAAAGKAKPSAYPACQLCAENEGYAGRMDHPARQNHRPVPLTLAGEQWYLQYSPYVYYNEHCIIFNQKHVPMVISGAAFRKLLGVVTLFPHYFAGSNADLPIVGGSILSHEHFQGGRYVFPMERAGIETPVGFAGYEDITAGIVNWPMSALRITGADPERLAALAGKILTCWRGYSDPSVMILAETDGEPHNTITPIARRRGELYELDLVLRNNLTTKEHPLGLYHPHAALHHIKKENIGLIEVMGLAILPARLKTELKAVENTLLNGGDLRADPLTEKHADWAEEISSRRALTAENCGEVLKEEVGRVFEQVLEDAGVYKRTPEGKAAFLRFIECVNKGGPSC